MITQDHSEILERPIDELEACKTPNESEIIVYNDDVNTFDHVIYSLVQVCEHDPLQAEQCALIIHYNGKCGVKTGDRKSLEPRLEALLSRGLSAKIE